MSKGTMKPTTTLATRAIAAGLAISAGLASVPAGAQQLPQAQSQRLDAAGANYSSYRDRGWSGNRGAIIAGAVGLGVLGAAIAASRPAYGYGYAEPAYAEPVYAEPEPYGYGYGYGHAQVYEAPVYEAPVVIYPRRRGPYADTYRGAPDPARGGR